MKNSDLPTAADSILVIEFQTSNYNACFGELYRRHYQNLFFYCKKIVGSPHDGYDICADTFIKAAENIQQLHQADQFASWLFRIARNACMDFLKAKKKLKQDSIDDKWELAAAESDQEAYLAKEALFEKLDLLMSKVDPADRKLLIEKYIHQRFTNSI